MDGIDTARKHASTSIPTVLQELDYTIVDCDDLYEKSRTVDDIVDPSSLPAVGEPTIQEGSASDADKMADYEADGGVVAASYGEGSTSSRMSPGSDHNIHVADTWGNLLKVVNTY